MSDQMALLPAPPTAAPAARPAAAVVSWDLDDGTREAGRRGLASAREALRQASARVAA